MMTWAFYQFSQTLEHLCNRYGSRLVRITEEYTSKTCTKCGHVHHKLGGSKMFKCPHCGYEIPRDFNGAVGIFLKALWDTTFIDQVGNVVLDVHSGPRCRRMSRLKVSASSVVDSGFFWYSMSIFTAYTPS